MYSKSGISVRTRTPSKILEVFAFSHQRESPAAGPLYIFAFPPSIATLVFNRAIVESCPDTTTSKRDQDRQRDAWKYGGLQQHDERRLERVHVHVCPAARYQYCRSLVCMTSLLSRALEVDLHLRYRPRAYEIPVADSNCVSSYVFALARTVEGFKFLVCGFL